MVEAILIIIFSLVLFVYWFRYTILLLLSKDPGEEHAAVISQLTVRETRDILRRAPDGLPLDPLHRALEKDYRMLRYLLDHAAGLDVRPMEDFLLTLDFQLLRIRYRLTRKFSSRQARQTLQEMAGIVSHIAYKMGERAALPASRLTTLTQP